MKSAFAIVALALAIAPALLAQEAAPANPGRLPVVPAPAPAAAPAPAVEPEVTLIPEQVPQNKKPAEAAPEKKSKTEESAEELLERIHFREARTKALRDPGVQAEWDRSNKAKTDYARREALKTYYNRLYDRILTIDGSVKKTADFRRQASLHRLEQTRLDPT
ncbi:MAG TPA: hypothetical protein VEO95_04610, partial [Chthoniobacteraceae bacterium]|nr:hypothetical protein [Chthoniobacteraceae bacterium]